VLLLKRIDARVLLMFGFSMIAVGSWIDGGLTHDWFSEDFRVSQLIEAVGLAFAITALITFGSPTSHRRRRRRSVRRSRSPGGWAMKSAAR